MLLRNGKRFMNIENQPFRTILLPEKIPKKEKKQLYKINIDFDEASKEWRKNKIHMGGGNFKYK